MQLQRLTEPFPLFFPLQGVLTCIPVAMAIPAPLRKPCHPRVSGTELWGSAEPAPGAAARERQGCAGQDRGSSPARQSHSAASSSINNQPCSEIRGHVQTDRVWARRCQATLATHTQAGPPSGAAASLYGLGSDNKCRCASSLL